MSTIRSTYLHLRLTPEFGGSTPPFLHTRVMLLFVMRPEHSAYPKVLQASLITTTSGIIRSRCFHDLVLGEIAYGSRREIETINGQNLRQIFAVSPLH